MLRSSRRAIRAASLFIALQSSVAGAYPLDAAEESGIRRLLGYQAAQQQSGGPRLPPGALLGSNDISLNLLAADGQSEELADFDQQAPQPALQGAIESIFKDRDPSYGVVVVDLIDRDNIAWAALRPDIHHNVGSVGKIITMLGLFDTLARVYPSTGERRQLLKNTSARADNWVRLDEHDVPHYQPDSGLNRFAIIDEQDQFHLSEWVDHMISPSANAAGSVVWRETMLLQHFAGQYPPTEEQRLAFFSNSSSRYLADLASEVSDGALRRANFDTAKIRQGSFWTRDGKSKIAGGQSYATPLELARFFYRMEQGRLVDAWSSLEMKRYLYMTKRRYRYVYAPELRRAAVYFKSGSLYQCQPEEGFRCGKYRGNKTNRMNSVTLVESPPGEEKPYRYIVALVSNVLKVNSAWDHSRLAVAIHQAVLTRSAVKVQEEEKNEKVLTEVGKG